MALVTFMSDYGWEDHYVAAVKAAMLAVNPSLNIVDISHNIRPFDIGHGAYVLNSVFRDFPKDSVHLVCLDTASSESSRLLAVKLEDHYFVGFDSGLFSLLSEMPATCVDLNGIQKVETTFPGKDVLAPAAANIASGKNIHDMGTTVDNLQRLFSRKVKATKREIVGNVIRVDKYGNLITNIEKKEYETIQKLIGNAPIEVQVGRESFHEFHQNYHEVDSGNCFLIWNSKGLLQIGINKGNAAELLGLKLDTPISIFFNT